MGANKWIFQQQNVSISLAHLRIKKHAGNIMETKNNIGLGIKELRTKFQTTWKTNLKKGVNKMKITKVSDNKEITKEMEDWFITRTDKHVSLVQKYAKKIEEAFPNLKGLVEQASTHDDTKYDEPEKTPYIFITWQYKMKDDGKEWKAPDDIKDMMNKATNHHVTSQKNRHHPESTCGKKTGLINRENRDAPPSGLVDGTKMNDIDIGEMCADWMSMSEEKGSTPQSWAKKNINIRWKFDEKQVELINKILDEVWDGKS